MIEIHLWRPDGTVEYVEWPVVPRVGEYYHDGSGWYLVDRIKHKRSYGAYSINVFLEDTHD